jgi:hypothetical protein
MTQIFIDLGDTAQESLIPQANSLSVISAVVDAVADGCSTTGSIAEAIGLSGRQGAYYPSAAYALGLVTEVSGGPTHEWVLSPLGAEFVGLNASERVDRLNDILSEIEWLDTYTCDGSEALRASWEKENGLSTETITRRLATIAAWAKFYADTTRVDQEKQILAAMTGTRERAPEVVARVAAAKVAAKRVLPKRSCPKCHISAAPAVKECEECGTDLTGL